MLFLLTCEKVAQDMKINWGLVKSKTLWRYEDLISKLLNVFKYDFVLEAYNHTLEEGQAYFGQIKIGYFSGASPPANLHHIEASLHRLNHFGITNYLALIQQVPSKEQCKVFLEQSGFEFEALIDLLNYLFRWVLPFRISVKELVDSFTADHSMSLEALKGQGINSNLDTLEQCRSSSARARLAEKLKLDINFILELSHRADISRLAFVRGKTITHLCAGGYCTLARIAAADLGQMQTDMEIYYKSIGKKAADFKSVIPLNWMIGGARILPSIIKV